MRNVLLPVAAALSIGSLSACGDDDPSAFECQNKATDCRGTGSTNQNPMDTGVSPDAGVGSSVSIDSGMGTGADAGNASPDAGPPPVKCVQDIVRVLAGAECGDMADFQLETCYSPLEKGGTGDTTTKITLLAKTTSACVIIAVYGDDGRPTGMLTDALGIPVLNVTPQEPAIDGVQTGEECAEPTPAWFRYHHGNQRNSPQIAEAHVRNARFSGCVEVLGAEIAEDSDTGSGN